MASATDAAPSGEVPASGPVAPRGLKGAACTEKLNPGCWIGLSSAWRSSGDVPSASGRALPARCASRPRRLSSRASGEA